MSVTRRATAAGARPGVVAEAGVCGRLGMGAAEIADAVGWSRGEFDQGAARWGELAAGRVLAQDAALGWWEGRARRWAAAARPNAGLWGKAMAGRFGADGYAAGAKAAGTRPEPAGPRREITNRDRAKAICLLLAQTQGGTEARRELDALSGTEDGDPASPPR